MLIQSTRLLSYTFCNLQRATHHIFFVVYIVVLHKYKFIYNLVQNVGQVLAVCVYLAAWLFVCLLPLDLLTLSAAPTSAVVPITAECMPTFEVTHGALQMCSGSPVKDALLKVRLQPEVAE